MSDVLDEAIANELRMVAALEAIAGELVKLNAKLDAAPILRAHIPRPGSIITG